MVDQLRMPVSADIRLNRAPVLDSSAVPMLTPEQRQVVLGDAIPSLLTQRKRLQEQVLYEQRPDAKIYLLDKDRTKRALDSLQDTIAKVDRGDVVAIDSIIAQNENEITKLQAELSTILKQLSVEITNDVAYQAFLVEKNALAKQIPALSVSGKEAELKANSIRIDTLNKLMLKTTAGGLGARQQAIELEVGNLQRQIQALNILKNQAQKNLVDAQIRPPKTPEKSPTDMEMIGAFMDADAAMSAALNYISPNALTPGARDKARVISPSERVRIQKILATLNDIRTLVTSLTYNRSTMHPLAVRHAEEMCRWWQTSGPAWIQNPI